MAGALSSLRISGGGIAQGLQILGRAWDEARSLVMHMLMNKLRITAARQRRSRHWRTCETPSVAGDEASGIVRCVDA